MSREQGQANGGPQNAAQRADAQSLAISAWIAPEGAEDGPMTSWMPSPAARRVFAAAGVRVAGYVQAVNADLRRASAAYIWTHEKMVAASSAAMIAWHAAREHGATGADEDAYREIADREMILRDLVAEAREEVIFRDRRSREVSGMMISWSLLSVGRGIGGTC